MKLERSRHGVSIGPKAGEGKFRLYSWAVARGAAKGAFKEAYRFGSGKQNGSGVNSISWAGVSYKEKNNDAPG